MNSYTLQDIYSSVIRFIGFAFKGLRLEVMEIPDHLLKKCNGKGRKRRAAFSAHDGNLLHSDAVPGERVRRSVKSGPVLGGAFGNSFKRSWNLAPYLKVCIVLFIRIFILGKV